MTILTGTTLFARALARHRARRALAWLLLRRDDRLLNDIGITRDALAADLGLSPDRGDPGTLSGADILDRRPGWLPVAQPMLLALHDASALGTAAMWPGPRLGVRN